jgi:tetratricopeptide (TPR) repeat protein
VEFEAMFDWDKFWQSVSGESGKWIAGIVFSAVVAAFLYFKKTIWSKFVTWKRMRPMRDGYYNILIADLDNDNEKQVHTKDIEQSLDSQFGTNDKKSAFRVQRCRETLVVGSQHDNELEGERAEKRGRDILRRCNADVLIWGAVAQDQNKTVLRLRFLPRDGEGTRPRGFELSEKKLELQADFGNEFGAVLATYAATGPLAALGEARDIGDILGPVTKKLAPLAKQPPAFFTGDQKATLEDAYAIACYRLGTLKDDRTALDDAATSWASAANYWRNRDFKKYAAAQWGRGETLLKLGDATGGVGSISAAVEGYQAALAQRANEKPSVDVATMQVTLAAVLIRLADFEGGTESLSRAISAYGAALKVWASPPKYPRGWATSQRDLGDAHFRFAERARDAQHLLAAIEAYRAPLTHLWTREFLPLDWGAMQSRISAALLLWGKLEGDRGRLLEAREAARSALEELSKGRKPFEFASKFLGLVSSDAAPHLREVTRKILDEIEGTLAQ